MTDDFRKVWCDLCMNKIYLNDFPPNWEEMESEEQYEYLNQQITASDGPDSLAGWREKEGHVVEEWVLICKRCGKPEGTSPTELLMGAEAAPDHQTYECPFDGTELKEVKVVSGHTHQCPKCETLHAPYGRDE